MTEDEVQTHIENLAVVMAQPILDSFGIWPAPHDIECSLEATTDAVSKVIVKMFEYSVSKGDAFTTENSIGMRTVNVVQVMAERIVDKTVREACEKLGVPYSGVVEEEAAE